MADARASLDPRTPVLVGVGQADQRPAAVADALAPIDLLAEAARAAEADSGADRLLAALDTVAVVRIHSWPYPDAAAALASGLGAEPRRTIATDDGGNYPQWLLNRAAAEIARGDADAVLIGGAECFRSQSLARREGTPPPWAHQDAGATPTIAHANPAELWHRTEWIRQLILPVTFFALFESALRAHHRWTIDEHRDRIAALWARLASGAEANPMAWDRSHHTAAEIRDPSPTNRMVSFPYTKLMNANINVDQAAAFVVCSVERARALGVPTDRWVFPWVGADASDHWHAATRDQLWRSPAIRLAGAAAFAEAGIGPDDLAHVDLYSCFPSAVQIAAAELGLGLDRPLTVTGGLAFAGGPLNDYVSHSIAAMAERLRADPGSMGLVTALGGFLTKHAIGIYSTTPPPAGYRQTDVQADVDALPSRAVLELPDGPVAIEASTVGHGRDGEPDRGVITALTADGARTIATTTDPDLLALLETEETAGRAATVDADGTLHLL